MTDGNSRTCSNEPTHIRSSSAWLNHELLRVTGADEHYLDAEIVERRREMAAQARHYRVVKPRAPAWFGGVGQFYRHFEQVEDEEVVDILKKFA